MEKKLQKVKIPIHKINYEQMFEFNAPPLIFILNLSCCNQLCLINPYELNIEGISITKEAAM
jgi:hypothetical protein